MTILVHSWRHPSAGTSGSWRRVRFIPAPASAGSASRTSLNQAVEYGSSSQSAIISGFQLSAIFGKPSPAKAAASSNPHRGQPLTAFPRVRSSKAFRRRPLYRVDRPCRAGIRNPYRTFSFGIKGGKVRNRRFSPVAARSGDRLLSEPTAGTQPCWQEPLFIPIPVIA